MTSENPIEAKKETFLIGAAQRIVGLLDAVAADDVDLLERRYRFDFSGGLCSNINITVDLHAITFVGNPFGPDVDADESTNRFDDKLILMRCARPMLKEIIEAVEGYEFYSGSREYPVGVEGIDAYFKEDGTQRTAGQVFWRSSTAFGSSLYDGEYGSRRRALAAHWANYIREKGWMDTAYEAEAPAE